MRKLIILSSILTVLLFLALFPANSYSAGRRPTKEEMERAGIIKSETVKGNNESPGRSKEEKEIENLYKRIDFEWAGETKFKDESEKFIKDSPKDKDAGKAMRMFGRYHIFRRRPEIAVAEAEKMIKRYKKYDIAAGGYMVIGDKYKKEMNYQKALENYDIVLTEYPNSQLTCSALIEKGSCLFKLGKDDEAKNSLQKVVDEYPEGQMAWMAFRSIKNIDKIKEIRTKQGKKQ